MLAATTLLDSFKETTQARILEEDEHYAIVAVRIEKAWLGRYVPFIGALLDRATVVPKMIAPAE